jgi:hypothetical protein
MRDPDAGGGAGSLGLESRKAAPAEEASRGGSMADGVSEEKQRAYFERTKKAVLLWLADQGGSAEMREMHDYSASKFLVAHQGFSKLMEACVDEGLVEFDRGTVSLTDAGRTLAAS